MDSPGLDDLNRGSLYKGL